MLYMDDADLPTPLLLSCVVGLLCQCSSDGLLPPEPRFCSCILLAQADVKT